MLVLLLFRTLTTTYLTNIIFTLSVGGLVNKVNGRRIGRHLFFWSFIIPEVRLSKCSWFRIWIRVRYSWGLLLRKTMQGSMSVTNRRNNEPSEKRTIRIMNLRKNKLSELWTFGKMNSRNMNLRKTNNQNNEPSENKTARIMHLRNYEP